jgi:tetratricopeptide (TPR) repeat protein
MTSARAIQLQICFLAALLAVVLSGCGGARARYVSHLERGKQYLEQGNLDKAGIEFRNALQIQPKDADALYYNGRVAAERRNSGDAIGFFQAAVDARPAFEAARAGLAKSLVFAGAPQRALDIIGPGLTQNPNSADLLAARAAARHQLKKDAEARADAERAVQLAPTNENAVAVLAALCASAGDRARAISLVSDAVRQVPSSVDLREILANLYLEGAQPNEAEEQMRQIIQLKPREIVPRIKLALVFARAHQLDPAQRVLEDAVKDFSNDKDRSRRDAARLALVDFIATERSREQGEKTLRGFIAEEPGNADLRLELGALLQRTGAVQDAIAAYQEVVSREGTGAQGLIARDRIATIQLSQGHVDAASRLIGEVLQKSPRDADALFMRANIALQHSDPTSAIADLRAVVRDQPKSVLIQRTLARAYLQKGQPALAEEAFRAALEAAPNDPTARIELAQFLTQTDRAPQAVTLLEDWLSRSPDDVPAREALIRAYVAKQDLPAARAAAEELKTRHPDTAAGFYFSGLVAAREKRWADSQKDLERALALQPRALEVLESLARLELDRGEGKVAVGQVQAGIERDPRNPQLLNLLGELYLEQKDLVNATDSFTRAAALDPHAWPPYRNLARVKIAANDLTGAIADYETASKIAPAEPRLIIELTSLYEKQGRIDDAIARYEALYKINPGSQPLAANNLAMLLVTYKSDQRSLDRARDLTSSFAASNDGQLLDTNGWVRFKRREYQDAAAVLERAVERAPDSKVIRYHLGMAELQLGQPERARSNLESALAGSGSFSGSEEARTALASLKARSG